MNGSNFGRIPALLIWSNMWKRSSRILAKNIKLILYRYLSESSRCNLWAAHFPLLAIPFQIGVEFLGIFSPTTKRSTQPLTRRQALFARLYRLNQDVHLLAVR